MGLETATSIADLNAGWPLGLDSVTQGDNHLRVIKAVLKAIFPGAGGQGLASPLNVTEAEFNALAGVTGNIESRLTAATFPAGTVMPFYQAAAPTGWTLVTANHDYMMRVVNSGGGTSGGSDSPILNNKVASHTHNASGTSTGIAGAHTHTVTPGQVIAPNYGGAGNIYGGTGSVEVATITTGSSGDHSHDLGALTISENTGAANWTPKYLNIILCSKN